MAESFDLLRDIYRVQHQRFRRTADELIDLLDLEETQRVPVGRAPFTVEVASDGRIFVVETGEKRVALYSPEFERLHTFAVKKRPIDVVLSHDEGEIYVTDEQDNRLLVFDVPAAEGAAPTSN